MLTRLEALELVSKELQRRSPPNDLFVVVEKHTIEKAFGWVFFYNSKKYLEKGTFRFRLAGNGPVIVNKDTGAIEFFGSNEPPEELIRDYEGRSAERGV
jgi:hypothetical protein